MPRIKPHPLALALAAAFSLNPALALADEDAPIALPTPPKAEGQTHVTADDMDGEMNVELKARGNVVVTRDDQKLESDWLNYYQNKDRVKAGDRFKMTRGVDVVTGTTLDYNVADYSGTGMDPVFAMGKPAPAAKGAPASTRPMSTVPMRGDGQQVDFRGQNLYRVYNSRINSCEPGDDSWYLNSSLLDLDYVNGVGVARNARLNFYGVPILYTPWMDFPLNGNRKSGFLPPTFKTGSNGTEVALPYYWNIAPNYDATITPHFNDKHGTMLGAEFRYLQPNYTGSIYTEQLPKDKVTDKNRYAWYATHNQTLAPGLSFGYNANYVSDPNYFKDFGDRLSIAANVNLVREAWLSYGFGWQGGSANATLRAQRYQTLLENPGPGDIPYARLPQLTFSVSQQLPQGFSANLQSELTRFSHPKLQNGDRLVAYPSLSWSLDKSWGFLKPKIGIHLTEYQLDALPGQQARSVSRSLPIFSTDAGLYFDRDTEFLGQDHLLTLEPRLFYVNIPTRNQNNLPNFDTSENDFNFAQLFTENRFSGSDRVNGANQLTTALTSRLVSQENGMERIRLTVGKRYYFNQDDITLAGVPQQRTVSGSNLLLGAGGDLAKGWRLDSSYEWNEALKTTERYNAQLRYNPAAGKVLSARYRYGRYEQLDNSSLYGPLRQVDIAAQWPIAKKWYALGRYNYSLADRKPLEQLAGFEYNDGCWSARMVGQRYVSDLTTTKNAIYFQLEFKGLGGFGNNPVNTLKLAIPGYSKTNDL
ncbi:LPS biosynthesis protein [Chromobacterium sp. LK1]|uniref:LPS-assembly protein LptD n=1 Tax=Chromobacterium sp. LK1 TaxID=1628193 RepID=UPI0006534E06|nr:LPS-assembly protein LptD [Chromobacterium sp. LK1]KMN37542.1 LPS biosynthesis protein [Chromobacterium sp. LK1]